MWTPDPTARAETSAATAGAGGLANEPVVSGSGRRSGARPGREAGALRGPLVAEKDGRGREADVDVTTGSTASGARPIPRASGERSRIPTPRWATTRAQARSS